MSVSLDKKIRVSSATRAALKEKKTGGEPFDTVIRRLILLWDLVGFTLPRDEADKLYEQAREKVA